MAAACARAGQGDGPDPHDGLDGAEGPGVDSSPEGSLVFGDSGACDAVRYAYYDAEDAIFAVLLFKLDGTGRFDEEIVYTSSGPDGQWNNADDVVGGRTHLLYDAVGRLTGVANHSSAGPDGVWGTPDDVQSGASTVAYDSSSHPSVIVDYSAPGPDSTWGTADDVIQARYVDRYDPSGDPLWQLIGVDPGPDATWGTADDVVGSASKAELHAPYDGVHYPKRVWFLSGAGPDGTWGDTHDVVANLRTFECTDHVVIKEYKEAGPDGVWGTADDVLSSQQSVKILGPSCGRDPCDQPVSIR
jgi:hypothetical protein